MAVGTNSPTHQSFGGADLVRGQRSALNNEPIAEKEERSRSTNIPVYLTVCLFGLGGTLPTRALWVELPSLSRKLPEGNTLSLYLLVILESANLAALAYLVAKRFARNHLSEIPFIYSTLGLGVISLVLMGCLWDHTTPILGQPNSFALLLSGFLAAIVSCVSIVTYIPFTARLKECYITAIFIGESLGSLIPHLLTIGQGITQKVVCVTSPEPTSKPITRGISFSHNSSGILDTDLNLEFLDQGDMIQTFGILPSGASQYIYNPYRTTTPPSVHELNLRFSEYTYFLLLAGVLGVSAGCFLLLRWCSVCHLQYVEPHIDQMEDVDPGAYRGGIPGGIPEDMWQMTCDGIQPLDDGSLRSDHPVKLKDGPYQVGPSVQKPISPSRIRFTSSGGSASPLHLNHRSSDARQSQHSQFTSTGSEITHASSVFQDGYNIASGKPRVFPLLIGITFWTSAILFGPLSTYKAYACFPTGNTTFLIGALLCDVVTIITCIITARGTIRGQTTIVIAMVCLGTILLTYFAALMTFSHASETHETSPLFGNVGEMLTAIAWTAITALFSYARVTIGVVCRQSENTSVIMWYSYAILVGAAAGTLSMADNISICKVFKSSVVPCK